MPAPKSPRAAACRVSVRKGELENVERNRDKSLGVTVYVGQRRGNASTSDFSRAALEQTVQAAYDIARFTAEDPVAGLPDEDDLATARSSRDLDLFHPWDVDERAGRRAGARCEAAALATDRRITNSEGAGVSAQQSRISSARNTRGFRGGYASSRHSISVAPHRRQAATTCSATPGTARCAPPTSWPSPRPWAAMPPSARCRA